MAVEPAKFPKALIPSTPNPQDGVGEADDQIRMIKGVIKSTLPNIDAAITATATTLNNPLIATTLAPDTLPYYNGDETATTTALTAFGRQIVGAANASVLASTALANTFVRLNGDTMTGPLVAPRVATPELRLGTANSSVVFTNATLADNTILDFGGGLAIHADRANKTFRFYVEGEAVAILNAAGFEHVGDLTAFSEG